MNTLFKNAKFVPLSIWMIGISGFLLNISAAIVFGLSALYLKHSLGATLGLIALLEGSVEAFANLTKLLSGVLSDYLCKRKILMVVGFAFATIARPILALFPYVSAVIIARIFDRLGNGIHSAPRDALVGDLAPQEIKGTCFGLRQAFAQAGSCVGGGICYFLMTHSNNDYVFAFWMATVPVVLGLIILLLFVHEPESNTLKEEIEKTHNKSAHHALHFSDLKRLGFPFWILMSLVAIFYLARVSENFLLIYANSHFGYTEAQTQLILMFYNGSNSLVSYPIGMISDRMPRIHFLLISVVLLIVADVILAFSSSNLLMLLGVCIWGVQIGISQSMFVALIVDKVPQDLRGVGIGIFYLLMSISLFLCGAAAKGLLKSFDLSYVFIASGFVAILALVLVFFMSKYFLTKNKNSYAN
ncbi:MAG: hypothetical protein HEEMFOPI_00395 [Holosporales bacterium]